MARWDQMTVARRQRAKQERKDGEEWLKMTRVTEAQVQATDEFGEDPAPGGNPPFRCGGVASSTAARRIIEENGRSFDPSAPASSGLTAVASVEELDGYPDQLKFWNRAL